MKNLNDFITEGRFDAEYRVSLNGCNDKYTDLPLEVTIVVNKSNRREFEDWLEKQEGDAFAHAQGGSVEY